MLSSSMQGEVPKDTDGHVYRVHLGRYSWETYGGRQVALTLRRAHAHSCSGLRVSLKTLEAAMSQGSHFQGMRAWEAAAATYLSGP